MIFSEHKDAKLVIINEKAPQNVVFLRGIRYIYILILFLVENASY